LDAGKHVLCEKPMVINSDQIKQVIEKAREKKKFVMEAFWSRFFPIWRKIREIIESNELGELKVVGLNFGEHLVGIFKTFLNFELIFRWKIVLNCTRMRVR
jgi:dihydrodiol dehydrogenase / D-xylose 1-dehydrogenase (NADP)